MAVSPVVTQTRESGQQSRVASSPLKRLASGQTSGNGTPRPAVSSTSAGHTLPPTLDVAEQMNEEEKRKYVKGNSIASYMWLRLS